MRTKRAFTIIELMLAMSFLGTMLVGIASLTMQITNIYQKGLALRSINANGREIVSDLTRIVNGSRVTVKINPEIPSNKHITETEIKEKRAEYFIETVTSDGENRQLGGVFCTGDYSYVWNTADNLRSVRDPNTHRISATEEELGGAGVYTIHVGSKTGGEFIVPKFARFIDKEREACTHDPTTLAPIQDKNVAMKANGAKRFDLGTTKTLKDINELIEDNESDLAMYNFTVYPATQHETTKQIFYSGMFILATVRGGVNIKSNGDFCEGSDNADGSRDTELTLNDFDYCAVNKFNFTARATGETGTNKTGE